MENLRILINDIVNPILNPISDNPFLFNFLQLSLLMYSGYFAPKLPYSLLNFFDSYTFRILILSLILYTSTAIDNPSLSILISVSYIATLNSIFKMKLLEGYGGLIQRDIDTDINKNFNNLDIPQDSDEGPVGLSPTSTVMY